MIERCHQGGSRSVAARVVAIILSVADRPGRSMADVARCAGLPVSTTHRLLGELVASRLVVRSPQGRYRIGASGRPGLGLAGVPITAPAIGGLTGADRATMVRSHVAAVLDDLASVTGLRARFGVWHERGVSILDRAAGRRPGVCMSGLNVVPVHATALGMALLAHAPKDEVRHVLAGRLPAYTDHTMTAPDALAAALAAARVRGVAVVRGEWRADESAIAVPVFGPAGVVAALELAGGTFPPNEAATALVIAARSLGGRLTEDAVALPSGIGPAPLRWPVDPTLPLDDTASSTA